MANERDDQALAELKWLRHNQAALDARLQRVEDSMVFQTLRAIGTFYQSHFRGNAAASASDYRNWAARNLRGRIAPDPGWAYQPLISIIGDGGPGQNYPHWERNGDRGEYVAELPAGVTLAPDALSRAVAAMQDERPGLVYFDHEIVDDSGQPIRPVFKPDWSPVLMESCDYLGEFVLRSRIPRNGVVHVPHVAYSTRTPLHFREGAVVPQVRPKVSILICTRDSGLIARCLTALRAKTNYSPFETTVIHHLGSNDDAGIARAADSAGAKRIEYTGEFNFSVMNNAGAKTAAGEILLFLNDDVEPIDSMWLDRMVARLERPETGAVGAKLLYPNGAIQHAGAVTWEMDGAGHPGRNLQSSEYWPWLNASREVTAVTGACLAVRRNDFEAMGGFDPAFPVNFNDVDLCLRYQERGQSVIYEAGAVLQHDESRTRRRGVHFEERRRFFLRWHNRVERTDPYYSPHLAQNNENLVLR